VNDSKPVSPSMTSDQARAAAALDASASADASVDLLMALLGEEGAAAMLGAPTDAGTPAPEMYAQMGKKEIRARVAKLAAERPEMLARIITHWIKEERSKGR